jgi:hypothetical protein
MDYPCLAVFTTQTPVRILREGGTSGWRVNPDRARHTPYLACIHNHTNPAGRVPGSTTVHRAVFLVARISGVVPATGDNRPHRFKICIASYVRHTAPDAWQGWPNPVKYTTLGHLGIDPDALDFHDLLEAQHHIARLTLRQDQRRQGKDVLF